MCCCVCVCGGRRERGKGGHGTSLSRYFVWQAALPPPLTPHTSHTSPHRPPPPPPQEAHPARLRCERMRADTSHQCAQRSLRRRQGGRVWGAAAHGGGGAGGGARQEGGGGVKREGCRFCENTTLCFFLEKGTLLAVSGEDTTPAVPLALKRMLWQPWVGAGLEEWGGNCRPMPPHFDQLPCARCAAPADAHARPPPSFPPATTDQCVESPWARALSFVGAGRRGRRGGERRNEMRSSLPQLPATHMRPRRRPAHPAQY